jgi:hypothetical protein
LVGSVVAASAGSFWVNLCNVLDVIQSDLVKKGAAEAVPFYLRRRLSFSNLLSGVALRERLNAPVCRSNRD